MIEIAPFRLVSASNANPSNPDLLSSSTDENGNGLKTESSDPDEKNGLEGTNGKDVKVVQSKNGGGEGDDLLGTPFYEPLSTSQVTFLRNQVLTCPLMCSSVLNADAMDTTYNLPRFDGFPPMSPDFLRMVLIEGCSLLIMDYTSTLFSAYYERRDRQIRRRQRFESLHHYMMSGLMVAAASAAFFLGQRK